MGQGTVPAQSVPLKFRLASGVRFVQPAALPVPPAGSSSLLDLPPAGLNSVPDSDTGAAGWSQSAAALSSELSGLLSRMTASRSFPPGPCPTRVTPQPLQPAVSTALVHCASLRGGSCRAEPLLQAVSQGSVRKSPATPSASSLFALPWASGPASDPRWVPDPLAPRLPSWCCCIPASGRHISERLVPCCPLPHRLPEVLPILTSRILLHSPCVTCGFFLDPLRAQSGGLFLLGRGFWGDFSAATV